MVGRADAIAAARAHPLARALRIDKLSLAALEATLRLYREPERARREIPVLAHARRATPTCCGRGRSGWPTRSARHRRRRDGAKVGGGALPLLELEGPVARRPRDPGPDGLARAAARGRPAA